MRRKADTERAGSARVIAWPTRVARACPSVPFCKLTIAVALRKFIAADTCASAAAMTARRARAVLTAAAAAGIWGKTETQARNVLEGKPVFFHRD